MHAPEITLAAAIRDSQSPRDSAREKAAKNLGPALLAELAIPGPAWRAADGHDDGPNVTEILGRLIESDPIPAVSGQAAVSLGLLGDAAVMDATGDWLVRAEDRDADAFLRQCALIAISFVGASAPTTAAGDDVRRDATKRLEAGMRSAHPDVRFQSAMGLVEVLGNEAEDRLVAALTGEEQPEVRLNIVCALSKITDLGSHARDTLYAVATEADATDETGFEAAAALAGAGDPRGGPRLVDALHVRVLRDRALEALAVLGDRAPTLATAAVQRLLRGWSTPSITRVRAAYALARVQPGAGGTRWLDRLAWHPRAAVREAVRDARAGLALLASRGS